MKISPPFQVVFVAAALFISAGRLPAPIQEASKTPTPAPSAPIKPQPKSKVESATAKKATSTLAETNLGFDGTWVGEEQKYIGTFDGKIYHPTFIIAGNGTLIGRLDGPAAGRFDHVVLKDGTLHFGAGNTTFELRLSNNGKTLNETMHVADKRADIWLTGHYHRQ